MDVIFKALRDLQEKIILEVDGDPSKPVSSRYILELIDLVKHVYIADKKINM